MGFLDFKMVTSLRQLSLQLVFVFLLFLIFLVDWFDIGILLEDVFENLTVLHASENTEHVVLVVFSLHILNDSAALEMIISFPNLDLFEIILYVFLA